MGRRLFYGVCVVVLVLVGTSQQIPAEQQAQRASETKSNAQPVPPAATIGANEARTQDQDKRGADGKPQALKDWLIGLFEIKLTDLLLVVFTGVLAWKTAGLFRETAGLREAADQQRADMLRSIEAAETSAKTSRDALITTERAFVFLEEVDVSPIYGARGSPNSAGHTGWEVREFIVRPRWRNNGNTPTKDMTILVNWTPWSGDLPEGFSYAYGENVRPAPMYLGPKATEWSDAVRFNAMEVTQVLEGRQSIFIWGRCDYRDIFEGTTPHRTIWCYRLIFTRSRPNPETQFVAFGPHNGSDEDTGRKHDGA